MDLIYSDVVGPIPIKGYDGSRYFVTFQCDFSKDAEVYLIKAKGDVADCFMHFKRHKERSELGETIKRLRDDNGGEYISGRLQKFLFTEGINWEPTEPYSPEMNGPAERLGQTLYRKAAPLLKYAGLDSKFWPEGIKHALYLYKRSPHSRIKMTPFEKSTGRKPYIGHIRCFGSKIYYSNSGPSKKFTHEKAKSGILVGYEGDSLCRILKPDGKIRRARALQIVERMMWQEFSPEDRKLGPDLDHFTDPTQPGKSIHIKPVEIAIPLPPVGRKRKLAADFWEEESSSLPSQPLVFPSSTLAPVIPVQPVQTEQSAAIRYPSVLPRTYEQFWYQFGEPAVQHSRPHPRSRSGGSLPQIKTETSPQPLRSYSRPQTISDGSPLQLSPRVFWQDQPPPRPPNPDRAAKQRPLFEDSDPDDLYHATPPLPVDHRKDHFTDLFADEADELALDASPNPPPPLFPGLIPPSYSTEDDLGDWEYLHHPELRPPSPSPSPSLAPSETPSTIQDYPTFKHLRRLSDSPDPLSLFLIPSCISAFDELSLTAFLSTANPCEAWEPQTLAQAMDSPQWPQWKKAMEEEFNSLVENSTWDPKIWDTLPSNKFPLSGKWVFKVKRGAHGEILRHKARWVVRGFLQKRGWISTKHSPLLSNQ